MIIKLRVLKRRQSNSWTNMELAHAGVLFCVRACESNYAFFLFLPVFVVIATECTLLRDHICPMIFHFLFPLFCLSISLSLSIYIMHAHTIKYTYTNANTRMAIRCTFYKGNCKHQPILCSAGNK